MAHQGPTNADTAPEALQQKERTRADRSETVKSETVKEVIPVVEERLRVDKLERETKLRVSKTVSERAETLEVPLEHTQVEVRRVAVGQPIDAPASVRTEGNVTIVPVMEERLVITKQLFLVEEVHLVRQTLSETHSETVSLREEHVTVHREEE